MKIKKFDNFKLNENIEDEKPEFTLNVEVKFKTTKEKEEAKSAIKKGIYWGLDSKRVSTPNDTKINFI